MAVKSRKRDTVDPVSMFDVMTWWEAVETEHGVVLTIDMGLAGLGGGGRLTVSVKAHKPSNDAHEPLIAEARLSWPTASHKTVLGLFVYLITSVERQLEASEALEAFSPPATS
jgi:hypothetical protein